MKKFLAVVGVVALVALVFIVALVALVAVKGRGLDEESKRYADNTIVAIVSTGTSAPCWTRLAPNL